ncbi:MAG TPA: branched-chain amino acid ABC transporter ATP-binding protein/permease [Chloroflexia bacterium]|nr:branched-chain amino acid ABC transporter ATP-binding protein/permease [Chloroflexia bacterium]
MSKTGNNMRYLLYGLLALVMLGNIVIFIQNPSDFDRFLINAMLGLSVYITLSAGLLSLANAGFMSLGAYTSAIIVAKLDLPLPLGLLGAMLLCGIIGLLVGLPVLRLTDVYLAIATLGFGEIVRVLIITNPDLTGGATGANLSTGFPYDRMQQTQTWMLVVALLVLIYLFFWLERSRTGRALRAIRQNSQAAATMGINVVFYRNLSFVISAVIAGAAGSLYAHSVGSLSNDVFSFTRAVEILSYAVLGGSTNWFGPILGAGLLTSLPIFLRETVTFLRDFAQLPNIINGLALMLVIIFLPGGLFNPSRFALRRAARHEAEIKREEAQAVMPEGPLPPELHPVSSAADGASVPAGKEALLELHDVKQSFGGLTAVDDVSFAIQKGGVYGLIGPNGAGKTTIINIISGLYKPTAGKIAFEGQDITARPAHRIAAMGIARTFQNIRLFSDMTVLENVVVGHHARIKTNLLTTWLRLPQERREEKAAREEALALLDRLGLTDFAELPASKLSYGDQRRVEIARALALDPRLLLLDEPAAGMNDVESRQLAEFILELKRQGYTILVIEHHIDLIMQVSDEILVLNFGRKIAQDRPAEVKQNPQVVEAYLGQS